MAAPNRSSPVYAPRVLGIAPFAAYLLRDANPLPFLSRAQRRVGDLFTLDLGLKSTLFLGHPAHATHVLQHRADMYVKRVTVKTPLAALIAQDGSTDTMSVDARKMRHAVQPYLRGDALTDLPDLLDTALARLERDWDQRNAWSQPLDLNRVVGLLAVDLMLTRFGSRPEHPDATGTYMDAVARALHHGRVRTLRNLAAARLGLALHRQQTTDDRGIESTIDRIVTAGQGPGAHDSTLFTAVIAGLGEAGKHPSAVRDAVIALLTAGHETVAAGAMWSMRLLLTHPTYYHAARDEVDGFHGRRLTLADLPRLPMMDAVVHEALRLYPPAWRITRTARADDAIDGYLVAAGASVLLSVYHIHRHAAFWNAADAFLPERFLGKLDECSHNGRAWLPFGKGQRSCVGADMGVKLLTLIVATLLQRYTLTPHDPIVPRNTLDDSAVFLDVTLRPARPQLVRVSRRA